MQWIEGDDGSPRSAPAVSPPCPTDRTLPTVNKPLHTFRHCWRHGAALLAAAVLCLAAPAGQSTGVPVYVVAKGWHAGLIVPADALNKRLPALRQRFAGAQHYEVGWGDAGFYRAKEVNVGLAMQAMFASQGAVMHVVAVPDVARFTRNSDAATLCLIPDQVDAIADAVARSFARDKHGAVVDAGPGIYGDSQFYQATGSYSLLYTCNRWTASVLAAAGLDISPRISLTAGSVLRAARQHGSACAAPTTTKE